MKQLDLFFVLDHPLYKINTSCCGKGGGGGGGVNYSAVGAAHQY